MPTINLFLLLGAGVLAGVFSTVAGVASIVSYPTLLAVGIPPLSANVTNTVSLAFTAVGATAGSQRELVGQRDRAMRLGVLTALGGAAGAALLLLTPARSFELVAPWMIAAATIFLFAHPRLGRATRPGPAERRTAHRVALFFVAIYAGYFGAAAGTLTLTVLVTMIDLPLVRINAMKNVLSGLSNSVAAVGFAVFGPVQWGAVVPLAAGFVAGGWIGPKVARRLSDGVLRVVVGICGLALAVKLGLDSYG